MGARHFIGRAGDPAGVIKFRSLRGLASGVCEGDPSLCSCCREAGATTAATIAAVRVSHYGFPELSLVVPQVVQLVENRNVNALNTVDVLQHNNRTTLGSDNNNKITIRIFP